MRRRGSSRDGKNDPSAAWGCAARGRRPWSRAAARGARCGGSSARGCARTARADRLGGLQLDQGLQHQLQPRADKVEVAAGAQCVQQLGQGRLVEGHRVLLASTCEVTLRFTRWPSVATGSRKSHHLKGHQPEAPTTLAVDEQQQRGSVPLLLDDGSTVGRLKVGGHLALEARQELAEVDRPVTGVWRADDLPVTMSPSDAGGPITGFDPQRSAAARPSVLQTVVPAARDPRQHPLCPRNRSRRVSAVPAKLVSRLVSGRARVRVPPPAPSLNRSRGCPCRAGG